MNIYFNTSGNFETGDLWFSLLESAINYLESAMAEF